MTSFSVVQIEVRTSFGRVRLGQDRNNIKKIKENCSFCLLKIKQNHVFAKDGPIHVHPQKSSMSKVHPHKSNVHSRKAATDPTDPAKDGTSGCQ